MGEKLFDKQVSDISTNPAGWGTVPQTIHQTFTALGLDDDLSVAVFTRTLDTVCRVGERMGSLQGQVSKDQGLK